MPPHDKFTTKEFIANMNKALSQLIRISKAVGKDSSLVQGGGGNTSVKTDDEKYMYIKASGTALKDMDAHCGWRRMNADLARSVIQDQLIAQLDVRTRETEVVNRLLLACDDDVTGHARPSVEAHLHAFLDRCVIHLHPSSVGAYVNAKNGKEQLMRLFRDENRPPLWVPYTDPGFMLAKRIAGLVGDYQNNFGKKPAILFLEKHGLIVCTKTADNALRIVRRVINRCNSRLTQPKAGRIKSANTEEINSVKLRIRKAFHEATGQHTMISHFNDDAIAAFCRRADAPKMLSAGVLTPDELVYANGSPMWVEKCDSKTIARRLSSLIDKGAKPSVAFMVRNLGLFVAGGRKIALTVRDIVAYSVFIRINAKRMGGIRTLTRRQQDFINQWESEAFRKRLTTGSAEAELQGRIAVVTGAGSGLGESIVVGLVRAGALVTLMDIDTKAVRRIEKVINSEYPDAQVTTIKCDVTDERDVANAFEQILDRWGGLDILVNAAGVAPAYPLVDMPVDKWRAALEVNLTGYFLLAQQAARIMIRQAIGGNIINLSSKSGLEASVDNTAYNATKAGEIHMARGWSLELGKHGIRVNSVAPGNVFEGSKIWNPKYIKACAQKYGIKPEQVIPYYVEKTALKREIKGLDVADAVVFLCSNRARNITGQTLVVDAGQVMVR